jgi:hypothetical protein
MVYPLTIVRDVRGHDASYRATVPRLSIAAAHRAVPEGSTLAAAQRVAHSAAV